MRKSIAPTVAAALAFIGLARAQDLTARKVESAFDTWTDASGIRNASLVLIKDNRGYATATTEPAASNSKLITGLCIARLADSGQVSFSSKLGRLLPGFFLRHKPADARAKDITIANLLTHGGGIAADAARCRRRPWDDWKL